MKNHYKIDIRWSDEDESYLARVPELDIVTHGSDEIEATKMAKEAIELMLETLEEENLPIPEPAADKEFNGQLPLRLGRVRHEDVYIRAKQQGLSMNEYVVKLIDDDEKGTDYVVRKLKSMSVKSPSAAKSASRRLVANKSKAKARGTKRSAKRM